MLFLHFVLVCFVYSKYCPKCAERLCWCIEFLQKSGYSFAHSLALCCWIRGSIGKGVQGLGIHISVLAGASCLLVEKAAEHIQPVGTGLSMPRK